MLGCIKIDAIILYGFDCKDVFKTYNKKGKYLYRIEVFLDVLAQPLQCFKNCQCHTLEMGK